MKDLEEQRQESRILIVDDNLGTVRVLAEILKEVGKIYFTTKSVDAYSLAQSVLPDLILLDVEMPDLDGFAVCEQLKRNVNFRDVPIMFITSHEDMEMESRALTSGAIDFVHKPPHPMVVKARVMNYLTLKHQTERLKMLSMVDDLTGIANRRAFDEALKNEWRRAYRNEYPLSILMLDVDYFKRYNDHYGHQAGDDSLRALGRVFADTVKRPGEMVARYGGEEFVVMLPNCPQDEACILGEMLCAGVRKLGIDHYTSDVAKIVTISVGVSCIVPGSDRMNGAKERGERPLIATDLLVSADQALYQTKHQGRNRVVS
ncbi:MAG: diguanylate cyclase [Gallionella sp.]